MTQGWDKHPNGASGSANSDLPTSSTPSPGPPPYPAYLPPDQAGQPAWARQAYAQGAYQPVDPQAGYPTAAYPYGPPPPGPAPVGQLQNGYPVPIHPGSEYHQQGFPPPGYPPYGQQSYPQQPSFGPTGYGPGYPPQNYPGFPGAGSVRPRRPGVITAASVLAFVQAGLLVIAGIATLSGGSALNDLDVGVGSVVSGVLTTMGVLTLVSAGLLIAGGVSAFNGTPWLMVAGAALSLVLSVWWVVQFDILGVILTWSLMLAVMPIISLSLVLGSTAKQWMATQNAANSP